MISQTSLSGNSTRKQAMVATWFSSLFGWYDFFIYSALASVISKYFFGGLDPTWAYILTLITSMSGFLVRPLGAVIAAPLADKIGRKYTFLIMMLVVGISTVIIGLLPGYETLGVLSPLILVTLRLIQGFALGSEYGAAYAYVNEYAPNNQRATYSAMMQSTAGLGFALTLITSSIGQSIDAEIFASWGWRIPFFMSIGFLFIATALRISLQESPVFMKLKSAESLAKRPVYDTYTNPKFVFRQIGLMLGVVAAHAVAWYTSHFFMRQFLIDIMHLSVNTVNILIFSAVACSLPFYFLWGKLADSIGRKKVMMIGTAFFLVTLFPVFYSIAKLANPTSAIITKQYPITIAADANTCDTQVNIFSPSTPKTACDIARNYFVKQGISYAFIPDYPGTKFSLMIGQKFFGDFNRVAVDEFLQKTGFQKSANLSFPELFLLFLLITVFMSLIAAFSPISTMLSEAFPTRIRCTAMSLPYHVGHGFFGGILTPIAFALMLSTGDIFYGLWYAFAIGFAAIIICFLFVRETKGQDIEQGDF